MNAIFGFVNLDGRPASREYLDAMGSALSDWGTDGGGAISIGSAAFGHALLAVTPESRFEAMPLYEANSDILFTAAARLDNREELCDFFSIPFSDRPALADGQLVLRAYHKWKGDCPRHLLGDWSFAVWDGRARRLFMARDHLGNTGLYYYHSPRIFIFASSIAAIIAHPEAPKELDEWRLARYLISYPADDWSRTFFRGVRLLVAGHSLSVTSEKTDMRDYWRLENAPAVRFKSQKDYLEGFLEHFRRSVRVRLRSSRPIGTTLSSGLDSGSVTALAAEDLQNRGQRLTAFTSVPLYQADHLVPGAISDEWPLAHAVTGRYDNIEHLAVRAEDISPMEAIRRSVAILHAPPVAAANMYWIMAILHEARERSLGVLLTGQLGNGGVSWSGGRDRIFCLFSEGKWDLGMRALTAWKMRQRCSWPKAIKSHILRPLLQPIWSQGRHFTLHSAIQPEFAQSMGLENYITRKRPILSLGSPLPPLRERLITINRNGANVGPVWHGLGSAFGLDVRDPTADVRLLEYCTGVPDELHSLNGGERMLIRGAMSDILPEDFRRNFRRGKQASDLALRLVATRDEIERKLACTESSIIVNKYINYTAMLRAWETLLRQVTLHNAHTASGLILRGFAAAEFLSSLHNINR